jgi:hypothetical protein
MASQWICVAHVALQGSFVQIGISVEPLSELVQQTPATLHNAPTTTDLTLFSQVSASIRAVRSLTMGQRTVESLFNYACSFSTSPEQVGDQSFAYWHLMLYRHTNVFRLVKSSSRSQCSTGGTSRTWASWPATLSSGGPLRQNDTPVFEFHQSIAAHQDTNTRKVLVLANVSVPPAHCMAILNLGLKKAAEALKLR